MKSKKGLWFLLVSLFVLASTFAHGKGDVEELEVQNLNSWQEKFDLESKTKKKAVKYNIMITAKDLGGNQTVEGPYNIWIDPESDRPIVGITNPYADMRIVGNLNIVGTCVDDDAVERVELILDEGKVNSAGESIEHKEVAKGKEFWSYYLDTTNLEEGPHTIKVIGYDINGLESRPLVLQWQLDRKQPVTKVQNLGMGQLVSGNVKFTGMVNDGNGIKELWYSVNNGKAFAPVKIENSKNAKIPKTRPKNEVVEFSLTVDTKKFDDGPAVLWFKARDESGSIGYYSFLYFIDNTKPDVKIVYPKDNEKSNGKFTIAGYAKDKIGIEKLNWTFGDQKGEFELIPGNPYWAVTVDVTKSNEKARKFTIEAMDKAGNVVSETRNISLDNEKDKPIVTLSDPVPNQVFAGEDVGVFARGIAVDDDSVQLIRFQLDGGEVVEKESKGAFAYELCRAKDLSAGTHKITVVAVDENGVASEPVSVQIVSKGVAPVFQTGIVKASGGNKEFVNGMEIHPESGSTFEVTVNSQLGIKKVHTEMAWGKNGLKADDIDLKDVSSYTYSCAINDSTPRGLVAIRIKAIDVLDRVADFNGFIYVTNTSVVKGKELQLIMNDSVFNEVDGMLEVQNNPEFPVTAFVSGGNAVSVELSPATPFARARLMGNQVVVTGTNQIGRSSPVRIRVHTDVNGRVLESKPIIFKNDNVLPVITLRNQSAEKSVKATGPVTISGSVYCETGVGKVSYRIFKVQAEINANTNVVEKVSSVISDEYKQVRVGSDGSFRFACDVSGEQPGMFLVEVIAESAGGNKAAKAVLLNTLPEPLEDGKGGVYSGKAFVNWFDGIDVYAVATYQGEIDKEFQTYPRSEMTEGANSKQFSCTAGGKVTNSSFTALKEPTIDYHFALIDEEQYRSGMAVVLDKAVKSQHKIVAYIDTVANISSVSYEITGEKTFGGDEKQSGNASISKPAEGTNRWIAEIPIGNLPSRMNNIKLTIKSPAFGDKELTGSFATVRPVPEEQDDSLKVYEFPGSGTFYDSVDANYVMSDGSKFYFYANITSTFKSELIGAQSGLEIEQNGNLIVVTATKDGNYRGVRLRATDTYGRVFESKSVNLLADSEGPVLAAESQSPKVNTWARNTLVLQGAAQDALGVRSVEYSLNKGETWTKFSISPGRGVTFSREVDLSKMDDGLITVDYRATDNAGHVSYYRSAIVKDTKAPEVNVVLPLAGDVVNGDNLIVFEVSDDGYFNRASYTYGGRNNKLDLGNVVYTHVGTKDQPLDSRMSFVFADIAGNAKTLNSWDFKVDNKSDLPVAEIHIPEEMEVITRDFTVSGVVYDDDGESTVFYRIDNGEYKQVAKGETYGTRISDAEYGLSSSYEIKVPISEMTDNEHSVTVYAVDVNGVRGEEVKRKFRVSLEEPKGSVELPRIDTSVREVVEISGVASDKNGIGKVEISLDNGNSYNEATGKERWSYRFDTRAIPGGTSVVFLRITDNYGITGLYSSLINIDNDAPEIKLELPLDDSTSTGQLFFAGYAFDNVEITNMYATIRNMDRTSSSIVRRLKIDRIIGETMDITDLPNGFYNVEVSGEDKAGNRTNVSRNIHLDKNKPAATVDILYPLNGEHKNGYFNIYGQAEAASGSKIDKLVLYVDNKAVKETALTDSGYFKFEITPPSSKKTGEYDEESGEEIVRETADMTDGAHTYRVEAVLENGKHIPSRAQTINYTKVGPWITLDNFTYGDFAVERPYLRGRAGYFPSAEEEVYINSKEASKEEKLMYAAKKSIQKVEISFDNGKSFEELSKGSRWNYRVENQDLAQGYHFMIVRVTMENGDTAIDRTIVQIDNTKPSVRLISPGRGGRYNQELDVSGLSSDDVSLESVQISLRKGDKSAYEVPAFIQGLYVDFHFWGATLYDIGAGLTFFDDNVKLQAQWGQFTKEQRDKANEFLNKEETPMRYGGDNVFGFKLLANIATLPFSYFFGHDWEWLYANFTLGAQFSRFNETASGKPQWLSAVLAQVEFPRINFKKWSAFSVMGFYSEFALWFIPTDVAGDNINSMVFQYAVGLRWNIF